MLMFMMVNSLGECEYYGLFVFVLLVCGVKMGLLIVGNGFVFWFGVFGVLECWNGFIGMILFVVCVLLEDIVRVWCDGEWVDCVNFNCLFLKL